MPKGPFELKLVDGPGYEFGPDCTFQIEGNGVLKIFDPVNQRQIVYGPGAWLSVESRLADRRQ